MRHPRWVLLFLCCLVVLASPARAGTARIIVINGDAPGEGFNDPTPFTPLGGNNALTLGQARLNAFQYAADLLAARLNSSVTIRVGAQMNPLGVPQSGQAFQLGGASPVAVYYNFPNAPDTNTWYVSALANALAGSDLDPTLDDIVAVFNSDVDNATIPPDYRWYYGLDGNAPATASDFVSVVMHELTHGLGFYTLVDPSSGATYNGLNDAFMSWLEHHGATPPDFPSMTDAQRAAAAISITDLHWVGPALESDPYLSQLTAGFVGTHVEMYAPNPVEPGSSLAHFSDAVSPDELMEPFYKTPIHDPRLAFDVLQDMGWTINPQGTGTADLDVGLAVSANGIPTPLPSGTTVTYTATVSNPGPNIANNAILTVMLPPGAKLVSATPDVGTTSCSQKEQPVTCLFGDLNPDPTGTQVVHIVATLAFSGANLASAIMASASADSDLSNNSASTIVQVASPLSQIISGTGGGGGCALGTSRSIDPTLPIWLLMSLWYVLRRRRQ